MPTLRPETENPPAGGRGVSKEVLSAGSCPATAISPASHKARSGAKTDTWSIEEA